jgi:hypothetical protein
MRRDGRERKRCKMTGKYRWWSQADAMIANSRNPIRQRAYKCPFCGFWHTTSAPFRKPGEQRTARPPGEDAA